MKKIIICLFVFGLFLLVGCVKPTIEEETFTVTFVDVEGNVIKVVEVKKGEDVDIPTPPNIEGYKFVGWDQDLENITTDLTVKPIYEMEEDEEDEEEEDEKVYYKVKFYSEGNLIKEEDVEENKSATAPELDERIGYKFVGWDLDFTNVTSELVVNAIWEKLMGSSYVDSFKFQERIDFKSLLANLESSDVSFTISNIKNGGFRGTNELVYYNNPANFNTNIYGFEVAVNKNNIVIEMATKVEMPTDGFVLSAHGTSISKLEKLNIGDVVIFANNQANVYREPEITNPISLWIEIERIISEVINANENYLALDYILIEDTINEAIAIYNNLLTTYKSNEYDKASQLLLDLNFMLIEPTSVTVRAMWHYPLRASMYPETSKEGVKKFLEKVKQEGINRIYLNTNFNGRAIYKSEYLTTTLTTAYTYGEYSDYLECFIEEAHKLGIEVYAWTNTLIAGDGKKNYFYSSRGWELIGYNNEDNHGGMYFVDISNDELRQFLSDVYYELSHKYNLDGIEFDFIRYPVTRFSGNEILDWGYTESFMSKFMTEYNIEGDLRELVKTNTTIRNQFLDFKMEMLTSTVEMLANSIRKNNPNIKISAAVMPSPSGAKSTYLQDYLTWIEKGYVDVLEPMIYTSDNQDLKQKMESLRSIVGNRAEIVAGIFPEGSGANSSYNAMQIAIIEELGLSGASKFSSRTIFSSKLKDALKYMNRDYIVLPSATKEEIYQAYTSDLKDKLVNYYMERDDDTALKDLLDYINSNNQLDTNNEQLDEIANIISLVSNQKIKSKLNNELLKISKIIKNK